MLFSEFAKQTVVTNGGKVFNLSEGIEHIEALPVNKFIDVLSRMHELTATEKLDGSQLIVGIDNDGKFYTSRETKGTSQKIYTTDQYENESRNNGFRSAHLALREVLPELRSVMDKGEAVEVEVLFGRQPNAIIYGSNYIAFLRMIPGENKEAPKQAKIKRLHEILSNKKVEFTAPVVTTLDGIELVNQDVKQVWKFASTSNVNPQYLKIDFSEKLEALKKFIRANNNVGNLGLTNGEILGINLTSIKGKDLRAAVKAERERLTKIVNTDYKFKIKEVLLNQIVRKLSPALRDIEVSTEHDTGVEGIVLLDPDTLEQVKIVDKDVFTVINQFNYSIRNQIKAGGPAFRQQFTASVGRETNDIFGSVMRSAEEVFGFPGIGNSGGPKRYMRKLKGDTLEQTIKNAVEQSAIKNPNIVKDKLITAMDKSLTDLSAALTKYKAEWKDYSLELSTGRNIKYSDEINERTLMFFAEVRKELNSMKQQIGKASSLDGIIAVMFGKVLKDIH